MVDEMEPEAVIRAILGIDPEQELKPEDLDQALVWVQQMKQLEQMYAVALATVRTVLPQFWTMGPLPWISPINTPIC